MELFLYNATYRLWICKDCQYAVTPQRLEAHFRGHHGRHPSAATPALRQAALTAMLKRPWLDSGQLIDEQTQMVLLTATLPLVMEGELCRRMKHAREEVRIFRAQTSRRNIAYRLWQPKTPREVGRGPYAWIKTNPMVLFVQDRIRRSPGGKVIVYANIIGQVMAMAQVLGCEVYHSKQINKAGVLDRFIWGECPMIVATSTLGMGVDIPDIHSIIHMVDGKVNNRILLSRISILS
ncbi:hypothetical protein VTN00DRAFT_9051 [Thermoascus crustaceus]|uniref:uncharacterized protein n=1 Tax=Thermoascus crustaceus TaxID=5088 RepID=UPI003743AC0F